MNTYISIKQQSTAEVIVQKSKFITNIKRVTDETEANTFINNLKKSYWDASHNCYAYILGEKKQIQKQSDDGEPQGTAGLPILEVLKQKNICDAVAVVTRYFGGTKLGKGGLIRAYSHCVIDIIKHSQLIKRQELTPLSIEISYLKFGKIENHLINNGFTLNELAFYSTVTFKINVLPAKLPNVPEQIKQLSGGDVSLKTEDPIYNYVDIKTNN